MNDERAKLNAMIVEAMRAGHSYAQMNEATGMPVATIQLVIEKAGGL